MPLLRPVAGPFALALLTLAAGCGGSGDEPSAESSPARASGPLFAESVEEEPCAILTPEDVAAATGVPGSDIEQRAMGGVCLYSWRAAETRSRGDLNVMGFDVHESLERARQNYDRYTRDVTAEEAREGMAQLEERLDEKAAEEGMSDTERAAASSLTGAIEVGDVTHQRFDGIGSAASLSSEGALRILYGNVVVWIAGSTGDNLPHDAEVAREVARRVVANLDRLAGR